MTHIRAAVACSLFVWVVPAALGAPPAPGVCDDTPPKEIKELIDVLKDGKDHAVKPLSELDGAAPYLRREAKRAAAFNFARERLMLAALTPIEDRIYDRNKKRYAVWADTGRIDLCAEFLIVCEKKDGFALADQTLPLRKRISDHCFSSAEFDQRILDIMPDRNLFGIPTFAKERGQAVHEVGTELLLSATKDTFALVRAERCTTQAYTRQAWFAVVRSELLQDVSPPTGSTPDPDFAGEWYRSVVLVNNSLQLTRATESLIVCDGDVELRRGLGYKCVVIANGNIWSEKDKNGGGRECYFAATGNITFPKQKEAYKSAFHAGGTVTLAEKPKPTDIVREKQAVLPFGIRFFDPAEFGITLTGQKNGMKVTELEKDSPFAKYGIEVGDVIASIDDITTRTAPEFRRELRRALITESATLRVHRGEKVLTRIVFLDGIPTPTAPMPREVKPKTPPAAP